MYALTAKGVALPNDAAIVASPVLMLATFAVRPSAATGPLIAFAAHRKPLALTAPHVHWLHRRPEPLAGSPTQPARALARTSRPARHARTVTQTRRLRLSDDAQPPNLHHMVDVPDQPVSHDELIGSSSANRTAKTVEVTFLDCPAYVGTDGAVRCGLPAEAEARYCLGSTDGPLESAMIRCPLGHWFNGSIESLICASEHKRAPGTAGAASGAPRPSLTGGQVTAGPPATGR